MAMLPAAAGLTSSGKRILFFFCRKSKHSSSIVDPAVLSPYQEVISFQNHYSQIIGNYNENEHVKIGIFNFEIVKDSTCLAEILTNKHESRPEIEKKGIENANRA
jgi:hypothetical protein